MRTSEWVRAWVRNFRPWHQQRVADGCERTLLASKIANAPRGRAYRGDIMRFILVAIIAIFLGACVAPSTKKLGRVSVGMTKAEAIAAMGEPDSIAAKDGVEYLSYRLATSALDFDGSDTSTYFVRIVNGRVDSYGQKGDFDTTSKPKERIEVDVKQH